jgi:hypothetical protein
VTFSAAGTYTLSLTADDGIADPVSDEVVITVIDPANNTFSNWASNYDLGELTGFNDDADGDGMGNGLESYLGTNPGSSNRGAIMAELAMDRQNKTFTFRHPLNPSAPNDLVAAYRWSPDLGSFHGDGVSAGDTTVNFTQSSPDENNWVTVTATITGPMPERFFTHIQVTQQN